MNPAKLSLVTLIALGTLAAFVPVSRSQDNKDDSKPIPPAPSQRVRRATAGANAFDRMAERLKLTDEQKTKLKPIYQEEVGKVRDLRQETSFTTEQRRDKVRELRAQYLAKMKPILTTDQFDQLKKLREQGGGRGPRGVRQGGDAKPGGGDTQKQP